MAEKKYVSTRPVGTRNSAGIGYIILPTDKDRDKYIESCYNTGTISVMLEDGGMVDYVSISNHVLNYLEFPKTSEQLGSMLFWVNIPKKNIPVIVAVINKNDEIISIGEHQIIQSKDHKDGYIEISGNAKDGLLNITAKGKKSDKGVLNISVTNVDDTAELNLLVRGTSNIKTIGDTNLEVTNKIKIRIFDPDVDDKETVWYYEKGKGFSYKDEFDNEIEINSDGKINIKPSKQFNLFSGKEPLVKGDTLKSELDKLSARVDLLYKAIQTGVPAAGSADGGTAFKSSMLGVLAAAVSESFNNINSDKSFTD